MKKSSLITKILLLAIVSVTSFSCSNDNDNTTDNIVAPDTYSFDRNGINTVSYSGQTTRLFQANELYSALNSTDVSLSTLNLMFNGDNDLSAGFTTESLNGTTKIIGSKTAASALAGDPATKSRFDNMLVEYVSEVVPALNAGNVAASGQAGLAFDSGYQLNEEGQELDQLFFKGLIGAFTLDQIVNNYVHPNQLDKGDYVAENDNGTLASGEDYTNMEHKWDEGFGYLYGEVDDISINNGLPAANESTGNLLMKYFKKVEQTYEPGIASTVYHAFIDGRTAILNKNYVARDLAADIIQVELSKVIGYYAIHYMNDYIAKLNSGEIAKAHHSLSEAHGFILSLQFTNNGDDMPFMDKITVENFLDNNLADFHNIDNNDLTDPTSGMIALVKQAFLDNGITLNID